MLSFLSFSKVIVINESKLWDIPLKETEGMNLVIPQSETTIVFHEKQNFHVELFDMQRNFVAYYYPEFDSILTLKNPCIITIKTKESFDAFPITSILFDKNCEFTIFTSNYQEIYNITQLNSFSEKGKFCFAFSSPNIESFDIKSNDDKLVHKENIGTIVIEKDIVNEDFYINVKANAKKDVIEYRQYYTEFLPSESKFVQNGNIIIFANKTLSDEKIHKKYAKKLTIFAQPSTSIIFHTFDFDIKAFNNEGEFIANINKTNPGFDYGVINGGKIIVSDIADRVVSFSYFRTENLEYESINLVTATKNIVINAKINEGYIWVAPNQPFSITSDKITSMDVSVITPFWSLKSVDEQLNIYETTSVVIYFNKGNSVFNVCVETESLSDENSFSSVFVHSNIPKIIPQGDFNKETYIKEIKLSKEIEKKTIKLRVNEILKIDVQSEFYTVFIHNQNRTINYAEVDGENIEFKQLFDFKDKKGSVYIRSAEDKSINITFSAFIMNCDVKVFQNTDYKFSIRSPLDYTERNLSTINNYSICFAYSSLQQKKTKIETSYFHSINKGELFTKEKTKKLKKNCNININEDAFMIRSVLSVSIPFGTLVIDFYKENTARESESLSLIYQTDKPSEVTESCLYKEKYLIYYAVLSGNIEYKTNGIPLLVMLTKPKFAIVIHDKDYVADVYERDEYFGTFTPENYSYGAFLNNSGYAYIKSNSSIVHFSIQFMVSTVKTCNAYAISNNPDRAFSVVRRRDDLKSSRNFSLSNNFSVCYWFSTADRTLTYVDARIASVDRVYIMSENSIKVFADKRSREEFKGHSIFIDLDTMNKSKSKSLVVTHKRVRYNKNIIENLTTTFMNETSRILTNEHAMKDFNVVDDNDFLPDNAILYISTFAIIVILCCILIKVKKCVLDEYNVVNSFNLSNIITFDSPESDNDNEIRIASLPQSFPPTFVVGQIDPSAVVRARKMSFGVEEDVNINPYLTNMDISNKDLTSYYNEENPFNIEI